MTSLEDWQAGGDRIDINGETIFFRRAGVGPSLLLLHAFPSASWGFHKLWDALSSEYDVIAPDLPGSGFSDKPPKRDYSVAALADAIVDICTALGVERTHVLSHAYASTMAQELLARMRDARAAGAAPPLVLQSVCFINAGLFPEVGHRTAMQRLLLSPLGPIITKTFPAPFDAFAKRIRAQFGPTTQPTDAELTAIWRLLSAQDGRALVPKLLGYLRDRVAHRDRFVDALTDAPAPVSLMCAAGDKISGDNVIARWRELVGEASFAPLPDAVGHYPPLERPDEVLAAYRRLRTWMDAQSADGDRSDDATERGAGA